MVSELVRAQEWKVGLSAPFRRAAHMHIQETRSYRTTVTWSSLRLGDSRVPAGLDSRVPLWGGLEGKGGPACVEL